MFCFPDAEYWSPDRCNQETNLCGVGRTQFLVLTDLQGNRRFGYCRRILPEGDKFNVTLPIAYCLISSRKSRIYPMILDELETLHGSCDETLEETLRLLHAQSFPTTVNEPIMVCHNGKIVKQIKRPLGTFINHVTQNSFWGHFGPILSIFRPLHSFFFASHRSSQSALGTHWGRIGDVLGTLWGCLWGVWRLI